MNGVVCLTAQDDPAVRFVKSFNGVDAITFTNKATAVRLNRAESMCVRIATIMRDEAANGKAPSYFASTQAQSANGRPLQGEPIFDQYSGPNGAPRPVAPTYTNKKDANGIWRVLPPRRKVPQGYAIDIAMIFKGVPRGESIVSDTELHVIEKVFDPSVPFFAAFVASLPIASVVEEAPVAPVVEDLSNVTPMTRQEYNGIPAQLAQRMNIENPVFRKRLNLMLKQENNAREEQMRAYKEAQADA
jgi:hypothetical protein